MTTIAILLGIVYFIFAFSGIFLLMRMKVLMEFYSHCWKSFRSKTLRAHGPGKLNLMIDALGIVAVWMIITWVLGAQGMLMWKRTQQEVAKMLNEKVLTRTTS